MPGIIFQRFLLPASGKERQSAVPARRKEHPVDAAIRGDSAPGGEDAFALRLEVRAMAFVQLNWVHRLRPGRDERADTGVKGHTQALALTLCSRRGSC
jgi:hypothetical protein